MSTTTATWTVEVTQDDLDAGCQKSQTFCPVALALRRLTHDHVSVGSVWIYGSDPDGTVLWEIVTPGVVMGFIDSFDRGEEVKPFTFTVDAPA